MKALLRVGRRLATFLLAFVTMLALQVGMLNIIGSDSFPTDGAIAMTFVFALWEGWGGLIRKLLGDRAGSASSDRLN